MRRGRLLAVLAVLGPGIIAANAGNDAGGIATYASVGARYGYSLLWVMVLITVSLALVQSLAARMGAVTGKGLAELIRETYGIRWSVFATTAVLIANTGICISDFVGIGAALGLAGIPAQVSVPVAAVAIWLILVRGSYRAAERVFIWLTLPFFAYPIAAVLAKPDWGAAASGLVPHIHAGSAYLLLLVATAGTTITPYMQLYLQSATVERGSGPDDIASESREAVAGAVFADLVAAILPIATSYVVAESLGFEKGIGRGFRDAPAFTGVITAMIALSALVAIVPGVPVIGLLAAVTVLVTSTLSLTLVVTVAGA